MSEQVEPAAFPIVADTQGTAAMSNGPDSTPTEREAGEVAAVEWIKRLVGAWDCCATCAGGVLAERDRVVKAQAWDEGYFLGVGLPAALGHTFQNPYRAALAPETPEDQP